MQAAGAILQPGDPVEVTIQSKDCRKRTRRGSVISTSPKHCRVDLGLYTESFAYDQVSRVLEDGTTEPVVQQLSNEQVDRVITARNLERTFDLDALVNEFYPRPDEDGLPDWVERKPKEVEDQMGGIDPDKLEEIVRRYNAGEKVNEIKKALNMAVETLYEYINHADEQGLIVKRSRSFKRKGEPIDTPADAPISAHVSGFDPLDVTTLTDEQLRRLDEKLHAEAATRFFEEVI